MGANNETAFAKTIGLLAGIATIVTVVIAILDWLMPFSPVGPSPLAPSPTASITTNLDFPDVNATIIAIVIQQTLIASQQTPMFPTVYPTYTPYPTQNQSPTYMPPSPITVTVVPPTVVPLPTYTPYPTLTPYPILEYPTLSVRARIDGISRLVIQLDTVRWYHLVAAAPGRWTRAATTLNGIDWYPTWPDTPDDKNRDCECYSSVYQGIPVITGSPSVILEIIQARGRVSIIQQPSQSNEYTLIIEFDDIVDPDRTFGDDLYEIRLTGITP